MNIRTATFTIIECWCVAGLAQRFCQVKETSKVLAGSHSQQVSRFHRNLKLSQGEELGRLQQVALSPETKSVELLEIIGAEQQFEVTFVEVEEVSKRGLYQCMVQLSTVPVAVCYGVGENPVEAKHAAALDALDYLQLMTRK